MSAPAPVPLPAMAVDTNPFPGLRAFEPSESEFFFGRDEEIEELARRLRTHRFLAVVGTSGTGKSSLVRAGVVPLLQRRGRPSDPKWRVVICRPGADPIGRLAGKLSVEFGGASGEMEAELRHSGLGLATVGRRLASDERLLVVVDQFEELFRFRQEGGDGRGRNEHAAAFVRLLLNATGYGGLSAPGGLSPVYAVLTMRSDYLGQCTRFSGLPEALNDSQYLIPRMSRDQQREAIEAPLALAGSGMPPALVQQLLGDAGHEPDLLPVLQHALRRMWEVSVEDRARGDALSENHYKAVGRLATALDKDAEEAYRQLGADKRKEQIARRLFQCLVAPRAKNDEETRRPTKRSDIVRICGASSAETDAVIQVFGNRGFLALSDDEDPTIDISHESLIRLWHRLRGWAQEEQELSEVYFRLADSAGKGFAAYRARELEQALKWKREGLNEAWAARYNPDPAAHARALGFLERSRWRQIGIWFGLVALVAIVPIEMSSRAAKRELEAEAAKSNAQLAVLRSTISLERELRETSEYAAKLRGSGDDKSLQLAVALEARAAAIQKDKEALEQDLRKKVDFVAQLEARLKTAEDSVGTLRKQRDQMHEELVAARNAQIKPAPTPSFAAFRVRVTAVRPIQDGVKGMADEWDFKLVVGARAPVGAVGGSPFPFTVEGPPRDGQALKNVTDVRGDRSLELEIRGQTRIGALIDVSLEAQRPGDSHKATGRRTFLVTREAGDPAAEMAVLVREDPEKGTFVAVLSVSVTPLP